MIGYGFTGSFCTLSRGVAEMEKLIAEGHTVLPLMSETVYTTDTRFGRAEDIRRRVGEATGNGIVHTVVDAEPLGPARPLELLILAPCTGNTLAKIAQGITDTAITMAAKAHLRRDRPLLIALASNDLLSANLQNVARMITRRGVYFVPMVQDDPENKPHSLVADFTLIPDCVSAALAGKQIRPLFL
ncbi:MAG: dipicolinate synthase subunit B [Clostridia bacterium]|nr:dipicolinate synthase subunit B [Clostridia bacterium]